jgi:hypothetical protein
MYVTNGRLELFLMENPDLKNMVSYLTECPKNVLLTLEYSDFFYEKADSLLMSGLIELHGDKIFMPIYDVFEDMEDDLVEALEVAPLTSINLIPDKIINGRILTLYAKECLIKGFDKLDMPSEMLLYYYHIAADYADPKSVDAAKYWIEEAEKWGYKYFILDLDHDLGDYQSCGGDGIKLLDWLVETGRTTSNYQIRLHTMNVVGRENMQRMIDRYWEGKRI